MLNGVRAVSFRFCPVCPLSLCQVVTRSGTLEPARNENARTAMTAKRELLSRIQLLRITSLADLYAAFILTRGWQTKITSKARPNYEHGTLEIRPDFEAWTTNIFRLTLAF